MSVISSTRPATLDEIAAEMDRRGAVIERLEATIAALQEADKVRVTDLTRHIERADKAEEERDALLSAAGPTGSKIDPSTLNFVWYQRGERTWKAGTPDYELVVHQSATTGLWSWTLQNGGQLAIASRAIAMTDAEEACRRRIARDLKIGERASIACIVLAAAARANAPAPDARTRLLDRTACHAAMRAAVGGRASAIDVGKAAADILAECIGLSAPDLATAQKTAVQTGHDVAECIATNWPEIEHARRLATDEPEGRA